MNEVWLALPTGIGIATVASAVGIGGGILWMPFLIIMLRLKPETAVLTSLIIQSAGMGSGAVAYRRQDRIDYRLAGLLLLITAPGIAAGAYAASITSPAHMELILGLLTLSTAFLFVSSNQQYHDVGGMRAQRRGANPYLGFISLLSIVSGMLSISIGEWLIPDHAQQNGPAHERCRGHKHCRNIWNVPDRCRQPRAPGQSPPMGRDFLGGPRGIDRRPDWAPIGGTHQRAKAQRHFYLLVDTDRHSFDL
jgi:hypothetical protein